MIAVYDFVPVYCPNCGAETRLQGTHPTQNFPLDADYRAGASYACDCGLLYQYTHRDAILQAADAHEHGDLREYA